MSGGHFDYKQYKIRDIIESVEEYLYGDELSDDDIEYLKNDYEKNWLDEDDWKYITENHRTIPNRFMFSDETLVEFKKGLEILKKAEVYAQRMDWLLSGDDGEDTFHKRLKEELDKINCPVTN